MARKPPEETTIGDATIEARLLVAYVRSKPRLLKAIVTSVTDRADPSTPHPIVPARAKVSQRPASLTEHELRDSISRTVIIWPLVPEDSDDTAPVSRVPQSKRHKSPDLGYAFWLTGTIRGHATIKGGRLKSITPLEYGPLSPAPSLENHTLGSGPEADDALRASIDLATKSLRWRLEPGRLVRDPA